MIHGIQVLVGDVVELAPHKRANVDDLNLERCTVLELNEQTRHVKVVFNANNKRNEKVFGIDRPVDWFSTDHVTDIERDYKVIDVSDNIDTSNRQTVSIVTMSPVVKQVVHSNKGYTITGRVDESKTDIFIFIGWNVDELDEYTGTINRITFSNFRIEDTNINGTMRTAYYILNSIRSPEDVFIKV